MRIRHRLCAISLFVISNIAFAGFDEGRAAYEVGDFKTAISEFQPLAEQGDAQAQNYLGLMYGDIKGKSFSPQKADKWWRKAAEQGNASAQYNLGLMYIDGQIAQPDDEEAIKWLRKSAEQGIAGAQDHVGDLYRHGELGVLADEKEAIKWYRKAAEQGYANSQRSLGLVYHFGEGVPQDDKEAYAWFSVAVANGYGEALDYRNKAGSNLTPEQLVQAQALAKEYFEKYQPMP